MKHAKPHDSSQKANAEKLNDVKYRFSFQPEKQIVIKYVNL